MSYSKGRLTLQLLIFFLVVGTTVARGGRGGGRSGGRFSSRSSSRSYRGGTTVILVSRYGSAQRYDRERRLVCHSCTSADSATCGEDFTPSTSVESCPGTVAVSQGSCGLICGEGDPCLMKITNTSTGALYTRGCGSRSDDYVGCKDIGTETICYCFKDYCNNVSEPSLYASATRIVSCLLLIALQALLGSKVLQCIY